MSEIRGERIELIGGKSLIAIYRFSFHINKIKHSLKTHVVAYTVSLLLIVTVFYGGQRNYQLKFPKLFPFLKKHHNLCNTKKDLNFEKIKRT